LPAASETVQQPVLSAPPPAPRAIPDPERAAAPAAPAAPATPPAPAAPAPQASVPKFALTKPGTLPVAPELEATDPAPAWPRPPAIAGSERADTPPPTARAVHPKAQSHAEALGNRRARGDRLTVEREPLPPIVAPAAPAPASADHRTSGYIGIYTTGPDGMRTFRSSP
jgi:hypothetical protein